MRRLFAWIAVVVAMSGPAMTQDFSGLARVDSAASTMRDTRGGAELTLYLSQVVPYRVFTVDDPQRLVIDFREVDWRGVTQDQIIDSRAVTSAHFGAFQAGWSRMVLELARPLSVQTAGMTVNTVDGTAILTLTLDHSDDAAFAAAAGVPAGAGWVAADQSTLPAPPEDDGIVVVAIDAGHGGIDPGAEHDGLREADLMLLLAAEISDTLNRIDGMQAVLTRSRDEFVPLDQRMTIARAAGADVFVSLHADALDGDTVTTGASVYTLSEQAQDTASQRMAERHDRSDLVAGLDLTGHDDTVATILMDIARLDTNPRSAALADQVVQGLRDTGARLNSNPRRHAVLAVLNAPDFPSVLIEVGFLSSEADRAALRSPEGRARVAAGIVLALQRWAAADAARAELLRR